MNRSFTLVLGVLIHAATTLAQAPPEAINYNGVARDANGEPVADATIGLQLTIMQGDPITGTAVYAETHTTTTDAFGLFNVAIGFGTATSGTFAAIDWSMGDYHLAVALDISGGNNYLAMGSTQLLSVPYALYARSAGNQQYQTLSLSNDTLYLTNGGFVVMPEPTYTQTGLPTPTIVTTPATNVYSTTALLGGTISGVNSNQIISRGVVCGLEPNPFVHSSMSYNPTYYSGIGTGSFSVVTTPQLLQTGQTYYYRAFAETENHLVFYGNELTLTTVPATQAAGAGVVYYGTSYGSIVYGNGQEWMTENLRTSRFANGDTIPQQIEGLSLASGTPAFSRYAFDSGNNQIYGKLYNHYAVVDPRNLCPTGWHVPSQAELRALVDYWGGLGAPDKFKEAGNTHWEAPSNGTNESGFTALPGGASTGGSSSTAFFGINNRAYFWTSSPYPNLPQRSYGLQIDTSPSMINWDWSDSYHMSIRCIKD